MGFENLVVKLYWFPMTCINVGCPIVSLAAIDENVSLKKFKTEN